MNPIHFKFPKKVRHVPKDESQNALLEQALQLTARQVVILKRTAEGVTLKAIGIEFGISGKTVCYHVRIARKIIGAKSLADVVRWCFKTGVISCVALMLASCASRPSSIRHPPSSPPMPPTVTTRRSTTPAASPQTATVPGPDPLVRTLAWCYPPAELPTILLFRIYQTTNLTPPIVWTIFTNVPAPSLSVSFRGVLPQQFFILTAVDQSGSESDYNVKRACE